MKKRILIFAIVGIALGLIAFSVTYAYLTSRSNDVATNFVMDNKITVIKEINNGKQLSDVKPGDSIPVKFQIINNSSNATSFYVRVKLLFEDSDVGNLFENFSVNSNWVYNSSDGYYYYEKMVTGTTPINLLSSIKVKSTATTAELKAYKNKFDIIFYAESIEPSGSSYTEAWK